MRLLPFLILVALVVSSRCEEEKRHSSHSGHVITDTSHSIGISFHSFGGYTERFLGGASGYVTSGGHLLLHRADSCRTAAVHVLDGGLHHASGFSHGVHDVISGILGRCCFFCQSMQHHRDQHHTVHPVITCPANIHVSADHRSTSQVVKIPTPKYSDPEGSSVKLSVRNLPHGNIFSEGCTTVRYTVTNSHGLSSSCLVTVSVTVKRCPRPNYIHNGRLTCTTSSGYLLLGESCAVSCNSGYQRKGASSVTCTGTNTLSAAMPVCEGSRCGSPPTPPTGNYTCPMGGTYGSACYLNCPPGSSPSHNKFYIMCERSGRWTSPGKCEVISHPSFLHANCSASITYTLMSGIAKAAVRWSDVLVDPTKGVGRVKVTQTVGPRSGTVVGPCRQTVVYEAVDETGNKATCYFTVDASRAVKTCKPPSYSFTDVNLNFTCPHSYNVGSSCTVQCKMGYPLVGSNRITCTDSPSATLGTRWTSVSGVPSCQKRNCPALQAPQNGALSCDKWVGGNMCQTQCQEGFLISRSAPANGMYACGSNTGTWKPSPHIMPCVASCLPQSFRAPGNVYYKGACPTSPSARAQIRSNFIKSLISSIFMSVCADRTQCNAQNVDVICGRVTGKRTTTYSVQLTFDIVVPYVAADGGGAMAVVAGQNLLNKIAAGIMNGVKSTSLNIPSFGLYTSSAALHVESMVMDCPQGTGPDYTSGACAGCPKGQYYNETNDSCDPVPKGFYQPSDNAVTSIQCPDGMSTETTGAKSRSECQEVCPPGQYSATGLAPCSLCGEGTFSSTPAAVDCITCSPGYTTRDSGATSLDSCIDAKYLHNECLSSPCGANNACEMLPDGYRCRCSGGYSGERCQTAPDHCLSHPCANNATCVTSPAGFVCRCASGYTGDRCQNQIVNGGWGVWSLWSNCSATCGQTGVMSRSRHCDSPAPQHGGRDCQGEATETESCNRELCPACETFPKPPNSVFECNQTGSTKSCKLSCELGYSFTNAPLTSYNCGPETGYTWDHVTRADGFLPFCNKMEAPGAMTIKSTMSYSGLKCSLIRSDIKHEQELTSQIEQLSRKLACKDGGFCSSKTEVNCSSPDRDVVVVLSLDISGVAGAGNLDVHAFFTDKKVSPDLTTYLQALLSMELTGTQLMNHTTSLLSVTVNNHNYTATTKGVVSTVHCDFGSIYQGSSCVKCDAGTRQVEDVCKLCDVNSFQPNEGQDHCITCPQGQITLQTGSTRPQDCINGD
ncbi:sushi, von Willebrand factor type A, EGF and pentraxin domain-containing protein 1-like [Haliotis rubra]|uniref:sushi, von Willebrand factor type A, EGF and pentraxin domain-containing protein 1-like n=1 Tax=Haliotis rubra TaxID=36100 RepID=UPI001EE60BE9|nr:sushi, von Willebrand factor type A, EGF and pentraxin domain-containing protein 1-like [Haliotis rubra]